VLILEHMTALGTGACTVAACGKKRMCRSADVGTRKMQRNIAEVICR